MRSDSLEWSYFEVQADISGVLLRPKGTQIFAIVLVGRKM